MLYGVSGTSYAESLLFLIHSELIYHYSEAAVIVSGLGWDPEVKKYNRGRNVEIRHIE